MVNLLSKIYAWFFGCQHAALSRVFTLERRSYKVCYDCGREFDYSLAQMKVTSQPLANAARLANVQPAVAEPAPATDWGSTRA